MIQFLGNAISSNDKQIYIYLHEAWWWLSLHHLFYQCYWVWLYESCWFFLSYSDFLTDMLKISCLPHPTETTISVGTNVCNNKLITMKSSLKRDLYFLRLRWKPTCCGGVLFLGLWSTAVWEEVFPPCTIYFLGFKHQDIKKNPPVGPFHQVLNFKRQTRYLGYHIFSCHQKGICIYIAWFCHRIVFRDTFMLLFFPVHQSTRLYEINFPLRTT